MRKLFLVLALLLGSLGGFTSPANAAHNHCGHYNDIYRSGNHSHSNGFYGSHYVNDRYAGSGQDYRGHLHYYNRYYDHGSGWVFQGTITKVCN